jgi:polyvinyl alcohol dehydrogenase (cytochrome)
MGNIALQESLAGGHARSVTDSNPQERSMQQSLRYAIGLGITLAGLTTIANLKSVFADSDSQSSDWPVAGQNINNWRNQSSEQKITVQNANQLSTKWTFTTGGDVSATPTVSGDAVYFPDWEGNLYAVDRNTGVRLWSRQISEYDGHPGSFSRVSPAVHNGDIIIGDTLSASAAHDGANIVAVNRQTGALHWIAQVDSHLAAVITGSPVVVGDMIFVGVSSNEEGLATNPNYPCCSFRGSVVALDANTGRIFWKRFTTPNNHGNSDGYSGNAVWQPPAVDLNRKLLYVGTGNNYEVPDEVKDCLDRSSESRQSLCFVPDDYFDSAMAIDMQTGVVKWSRRLQGFDIWTVACTRNPNPVSCPVSSSPDYDLGGSGPNLFPDLVGFGQKSGIYWALNPDDGSVVWSSAVGPGATLGGIEWGTATDGKRIYVAITNSGHKPYPLLDGSTITSGAWSALDVKTGKILWQTADPNQALDMGSVSVANGVLYAPSYSGNMHGLDAATGRILWSFQSGGSVLDGPSIVDGTVYWGSGYRHISPGQGNNKVYSFGVAGQ